MLDCAHYLTTAAPGVVVVGVCLLAGDGFVDVVVFDGVVVLFGFGVVVPLDLGRWPVVGPVGFELFK
jgi:hypothetical protein